MPIRIFSLIWNDLYVVNHLPLSTIVNNSSLGSYMLRWLVGTCVEQISQACNGPK